MDLKPVNDHDMEWVPCASCGSHLASPHAGIQRLVRCLDCGLIYVNPRPAPSQVLAQYNEHYFQCETPVRGGYENYMADAAEIVRTFERRLAGLEKFFPVDGGRDLLDVGCAAGFFLQAAKGRGWKGRGLEVCESQALEARRKGFEVAVSPLERASFPDGTFDLVTLWDVIEHFSDPAGALKSLHRWMKPGAQLVISTPDAGSWMARVFRSNWLGFRSVDEHLYFFSRPTMRRMLEAAGFQVQHAEYAGKYLNLERIVTRLRYYTRVGAALLRFSERAFPSASVYLNPLDTMLVLARKAP